jgi:hypothetical protein
MLREAWQSDIRAGGLPCPSQNRGNPTRSYRTREPLRIVGEVLGWEGHSPEVLRAMRDHLEKLKRHGIQAIND